MICAVPTGGSHYCAANCGALGSDDSAWMPPRSLYARDAVAPGAPRRMGCAGVSSNIAALPLQHAMAPGDAGIMSNLGNALREEGRMDEAKSLYESCPSTSPRKF
jgi:hypothetical protein